MAPHRNQAVFVCGTDTGVGKTLVTGMLCAWLNRHGIWAGAYKPMESGCRGPSGRTDSQFLKRMAQMPEPLNLINPYYFKEALAPGVAAQRERKRISLATIRKNLTLLQKKYDVVFVEGAGGLMVPVSGLKTNLDLIKTLGLPVLLIARLGLGTINHTLLTWECLKSHRVRVLGVVLNEITPRSTVAEKTNPVVLKKYGVPVWGVFPFMKLKVWGEKRF